MSRTVNSEWLFEESDRERLRLLIWAVAEFCGVEVITYAIMSNHFHVLINVPQKSFVEPEEVLRRYASLYSGPSRFRPENWEELREQVRGGTLRGFAWLEKQRRQMGDISHYMKLLKQRFTAVFNRVHQRHGTLWSERFKSVLVEHGLALSKMAVYIDLNPVRAGLVVDPKDYRFCGYAEAVAGNPLARRASVVITQRETWEQAAPEYRILLFGSACRPRPRGEVLNLGTLSEVLQQGGKIPQHILLACRLRYFTDGAVLGSARFVQEQLDRERIKYGRVVALEPKTIATLSDWGPLTVMRRPRFAIVLDA